MAQTSVLIIILPSLQGNPLQAELEASGRSFTDAAVDDSNAGQAGKMKKGKRDPSPLHRMLAPLTRPFSKLRTSRSTESKAGTKSQAQSRAGSYTDSLASRGTSASTQGTSVPGRFDSLPYQHQPQLPVAVGAADLQPSESFRFKQATAAAVPELSAEPSFAQDLAQPKPAPPTLIGTIPQSSAPGQPSQPAAAALPDSKAKATATLQHLPAQAASKEDDDDEFAYEIDDTGGFPIGVRDSAAPAFAAQPSTSTHPQHPHSSHMAADTAAHVDKPNPEARLGSRLPSVPAREFRPQHSRAELAPLSLPAASVYAPLQSGAATSPTMLAGAAHNASQKAGDPGLDHASGPVGLPFSQQGSQGQKQSSPGSVTGRQAANPDALGQLPSQAVQRELQSKQPAELGKVQLHMVEQGKQSQQSQQQQQQGRHVVGSLQAEASDADTSQSSACSSPRSIAASPDLQLTAVVKPHVQEPAASPSASMSHTDSVHGSPAGSGGALEVEKSLDSLKALQGAWPASPKHGFSDKPILGPGPITAHNSPVQLHTNSAFSPGTTDAPVVSSTSSHKPDQASSDALQKKVCCQAFASRRICLTVTTIGWV